MLNIRKGLALVLVAAAIIAGCSGTKEQPKEPAASTAPKAPVKVSFWHGMGPDSAHGKVTTKMIQEFNASQKDVIVEEVYQGSYGDLETKVTAALAANTPPMLVQATDSMVNNLMAAKALQSIDALIPAADKADYPKALLDPLTYGGKLYGVPFNRSALLLYYDKTLVPNPPKTWAEFHEIAKKVTVPGKVVGVAFGANAYYFQEFFMQNGGVWMDGDKATFNSKAGEEAMQFIVDMVKDGSAIQLKPKEYESDYMNSGRAAMVTTTSASLAYIKSAGEHPFGVAPLFTGPKGDSVPIAGANMVMIAGLKPEEQQAAAKFMLFMTGKEGTLEWAMGKTGYGPVRTSALADPRWTEFTKANPGYDVLGASLAKGVLMPNHPKWGQIQKELDTAVQAAILGQATPKAALDTAATKSNDILSKK